MSVATKFGQNIQIRVSEGFCREINKLDVSARLHAIGLITESLKKQEERLKPEDDAFHLTDLRGIGRGTWGSKEEIDEFLQQERESWDY